MNLEEELLLSHQHSGRHFGKALSKMKKQFDQWAESNLNRLGYPGFKMSYMPFVMNIAPGGTTNTELARMAGITKQAMSQVVKLLHAQGYIDIRSHETDRRCSVLFLTKKGKKFIIDTRSCVKSLSDEYKKLLGKKNYDIMIDGMLAITAYHENLKDKA